MFSNRMRVSFLQTGANQLEVRYTPRVTSDAFCPSIAIFFFDVEDAVDTRPACELGGWGGHIAYPRIESNHFCVWLEGSSCNLAGHIRFDASGLRYVEKSQP